MKRIQRKRTRGWRMPDNAIYVGRPTKWGNPFSIKSYGRQGAIKAYRFHLKRMVGPILDLSELAGHDLACWCSLDKPCHADVLIELCQGATRD